MKNYRLLTLSMSLPLFVGACAGTGGGGSNDGSNDWDPETRTCSWGGMDYEEDATFGEPDGCIVFRCTPDGVVEDENNLFSVSADLALASQEEVVDAACLREVSGSLFIGDQDGTSDIDDLSPLRHLVSVGQDLRVQGNPQLASMVGLRTSLSVLNSVQIVDNDAITTLAGLEFLASCVGCGQDPYPAFRATGGADEPGFTGGGDEGPPPAGQIYGDFVIAQNDRLETTWEISGLGTIWGALLIEENTALHEDGGFVELSDVSGDLSIRNNPAYATGDAQNLASRVAVGGLSTVCGNLDGDPC